MKSHKFEVEDAKKYGVEKALLLEHLKFHQENNSGIEEYTINGYTWCHAKRKTLERMYPYMNGRSISRWLKELEEEGVVESCKPKIKGGVHTKYYRVIKQRGGFGQNDQSNGQGGPSENGQGDHSSIDNYSEITTMKGARAKIFNLLKNIGVPSFAKPLYKIPGFQEAYVDYWQYLKDDYGRWPSEVSVKTDYQQLVELMEVGNNPVEVIYQTIHAKAKSFFKIRDFSRKEPKSGDWDQAHLKSPAYREYTSK